MDKMNTLFLFFEKYIEDSSKIISIVRPKYVSIGYGPEDSYAHMFLCSQFKFDKQQLILKNIISQTKEDLEKPNIVLESYSLKEKNILSSNMDLFEKTFLCDTDNKVVREIVNECRNTLNKNELLKNDFVLCATLSNLLHKIV